MTRPHICFLQSQSIPWRQDGLSGLRDNCRVKALSVDEATRAVTAIVEYPRGYRMKRPQWITATEELLVLEGSLEVNGAFLGHHAYARWPSGYIRDIESPHGATVLTMFDKRPLVGSGHPPAYEDSDLVDACITWDLPWQTGAEGAVTGKPLSKTIFTKKLWVNEDTGEQSFLYSALPHHPPPEIMVGKFTHPMIEEIFCLGGEYTFGDVGRMGPGGYCWWREQQWHGPAGSREGYNLFIRVHGGPLQNEFSKDSSLFSYLPDYRPALPDDLKDKAKPFNWPEKW